MSHSPLTEPRRVAAEPQFTVRWVLAHEPVAVFEEAARRFGESMAKRTSDAMRVRVMSLSEFAPGAPPMPLHVAWSLMSGRLEMTQTYTPLIGTLNPMYWLMDLPFLFRDHDHASRVLDGAVGQRLLGDLLPFNMRGLAFTYSGGFRMIATTGRAIERCEDLEGLRLRSSPSPVSMEALKLAGARPVPQASADIPAAVEAGEIDGAETTYPRYWALGQQKRLRVVSETWHSLFLTVLAVNERFYQTLPKAYQEAFVEAAREAALLERRHSIADGERVRLEAQAAGIQVCAMSETERSRLAARMRPVHERYAPLFGQDLLASVAAA
jgi:TRAP-type transport system periplasmic protein